MDQSIVRVAAVYSSSRHAQLRQQNVRPSARARQQPPLEVMELAAFPGSRPGTGRQGRSGVQSRRPRCGGAKKENLISDAGRDAKLCCAAGCVHNLGQLAATESELPFASTFYGAWRAEYMVATLGAASGWWRLSCRPGTLAWIGSPGPLRRGKVASRYLELRWVRLVRPSNYQAL
jgi:hypothetical protein